MVVCSSEAKGDIVAVSTDTDPVAVFLKEANTIAVTRSGKALRYVKLSSSLPVEIDEAAGGLVNMNI